MPHLVLHNVASEETAAGHLHISLAVQSASSLECKKSTLGNGGNRRCIIETRTISINYKLWSTNLLKPNFVSKCTFDHSRDSEFNTL